jgi:hypothetical protein
MISDYTKEVGLPSQKKTLPRPVAWLILALVGAGISFGVVQVIAQTRDYHASEKKSPAAAAPASAPAQAPAEK